MMNGNLPDGWTMITLAEASEVILGQSPTSDTYNTDGNGLPFYQGKTEFGDLYPTTVKWCSAPGKIAQAGDILISVRAPVGPTNLCREKSCIGRGLAALRPKNGMPNKYLLYYLRLIETEWDSKATGTTFKAITGDVLRQQEFPVAPLPEQERIVTKIEELFTQLDAGMAALKRVQAGLKRYKASVLKAAVEGKLLVNQKAESVKSSESAKELLKSFGKLPLIDDDLPTLPNGWCWTQLGDLALHITSGSRGWAQYYSNDGAIFIRAQDINTDKLVLEEIAHVNPPRDSAEIVRTRVQEKDLLITITGANVTKTAQVNVALDEAYISQHVGLVRPIIEELSDYLYYWIVCPTHGHKILEKLAYGAGKPGLNLTNIRELKVALPPLPEQQRIVAEVERRLEGAVQVESALVAAMARASRLRQAVLKSAFEGRLT